MDPERTKDWRELCKAAANELDPEKLMHLIAELTRALDERDKDRMLPRKSLDDGNSRQSRLLRSEPAV